MSKPEDDQSRVHKIEEKTKVFGKWYITGLFIFLGIGVIGILTNMIGGDTIVVTNVGDPAATAAAISHHITLRSLGGLFASAAIIGAFVTFAIGISTPIGKALHVHDKIGMETENPSIKKDLKKLRILPTIVLGFFAGFLILGMSQFIFALTGVDVLNAHDLIGSYTSGNYFVLGVGIAFFPISALIIKHIRKEYPKIEKLFPEPWRRI